MFALSHFYVFIFVFQLLMTCHFLGCNFAIAMAILFFFVNIDDISLAVRSHFSINTNNFRALTVNTNSSFSSSTNFANLLISLFVSYFFFFTYKSVVLSLPLLLKALLRCILVHIKFTLHQYQHIVLYVHFMPALVRILLPYTVHCVAL